MTLDKISLTAIYVECNNHLRDMDKNRDQVISFYLLLVGAFLAINNVQHATPFITQLGAFPAYVLSLFGLLVVAVVHEFRKWHTRYSHTAQLLVALARKGGPKRSAKMIERKAREKVYEAGGLDGPPLMSVMQWLWKRYIWGTESITYQASIVITSIPIYLALKPEIDTAMQWLQLQLRIGLHISASVIFGVYLIVLNIVSAYLLYRDVKKCPWATWLLFGIT